MRESRAAAHAISAGDPIPSVTSAAGYFSLRHALTAASLILALGAAAATLRASGLHEAALRSRPSVTSIDPFAGWYDATAITVTIHGGGFVAPWHTTADELRFSTQMWRRMHVADWNDVAAPLRTEALGHMITAYRAVLTEPRLWDRMTVADWDAVPQPIRMFAYRRMVAYWTGYYHVGHDYGLASRVVSDTCAAIVMTESWFDHRAVATTTGGNRDIGLAAASDFARQRMRVLHEQGVVDFGANDSEYSNPWIATRFVARWMALLLDETGGDLERAVRAYNRGSAAADDQLGTEYLAMVNARLNRFIRNRDAPPAWDYLWRSLRRWPPRVRPALNLHGRRQGPTPRTLTRRRQPIPRSQPNEYCAVFSVRDWC